MSLPYPRAVRAGASGFHKRRSELQEPAHKQMKAKADTLDNVLARINALAYHARAGDMAIIEFGEDWKVTLTWRMLKPWAR